jgi:hypothetical protein
MKPVQKTTWTREAALLRPLWNTASLQRPGPTWQRVFRTHMKTQSPRGGGEICSLFVTACLRYCVVPYLVRRDAAERCSKTEMMKGYTFKFYR